MNKTRWAEALGWLLGGPLLGAAMGGVVISICHQVAATSLGFLHGVGIGAFLGTLGAVVVLCTKASLPTHAARTIRGVVFAVHGTDDAWYYQDQDGGTHGPFNRSMMNTLLGAGAMLVDNTYAEPADVRPCQPKTRITRPNVLDLSKLPFDEATHVIAQAS